MIRPPSKRPLVVLLVVTAANTGAFAQRKGDMSCVDKLVPVINGLRTSVKAKACVKAVLPASPPTQLSFLDLPPNRTEVIRRIALLDECKTWYAEFQSTIRATKPPCMYWYSSDDGFDTASFNFTLTEYMTLMEWPVPASYQDPTPKPVLSKPINTMSLVAPTSSVPPATTIPASAAPLPWSLVDALIVVVVVMAAAC